MSGTPPNEAPVMCYSMKPLFKQFDSIRGSKQKSDSFWDTIVLTTADSAQTQAFQCQLERKMTRGEIPTSCTYRVIADPPGVKVGSGGSTIYVLHTIAQDTPGWESQKILVIHTGGQSKRLPLASALGKVFTSVPLGSPRYDMLETILAIFSPFAGMMPNGGVFVAPSDVLLTYELGDAQRTIRFDQGVVGVAHPANITVGRGHGVFVLEPQGVARGMEAEKEACDGSFMTSVGPAPRGDNSPLSSSGGDNDKSGSLWEPFLCECIRVLQKPTTEEMIASGAVVSRCEADVELSRVYTDSCFYLGADVTRKLVDFYQRFAPLDAEICAYGDFMRPLGREATDEYVGAAGADSARGRAQRRLYELLRPCAFSTLVMPRSRFYHIGTLPEYIASFCGADPTLTAELGLKTRVESSVLSCHGNGFTNGKESGVKETSENCHVTSVNGHDLGSTSNELGTSTSEVVSDASPPKRPHMRSDVLSTEQSSIRGCLIDSTVGDNSYIPVNSVLEHCRFPAGVRVGDRSVVSNCASPSKCASIPAGVFAHTIAVQHAGEPGFVTVVFGTDDDLKQDVSLQPVTDGDSHTTSCLMLGGHAHSLEELQGAMSSGSHDNDSSSKSEMFAPGSESLWNLRAFPFRCTRQESLESSLAWYGAVMGILQPECELAEKQKSPTARLSMCDAVQQKDIKRMVDFQTSDVNGEYGHLCSQGKVASAD